MIESFSFFDFSHLFCIVLRNRTLLAQFIRRNIDSRYKGSFLGILWSFVRPLLMLCIYMFVFSVIFKPRYEYEGGRSSFAIVMLCGLSIFQVFSESLTSSSRLIVSHPGYVKKVIFPLEILPLAQVLSIFILGGAWIILLFWGAVFIMNSISFVMLLLPLVLLPFFFFTIGLSYFFASLGVYIRDIPHMLVVVMQILFYMTPIFYPLQAVPGRYRWILCLNPLAPIIDQARRIFLYGSLPDWKVLGILFLASIIVMQLGLLWFVKTKKGFADVI